VAILILGYLTLFPLVSLVVGSFASTAADGSVVYGLANYISAYNDPIIAKLYLNSFVFSGGTCFVALGLGSVLAWIAERTNAPGRRYFLAMGLVPIIIPGVLSTISWIFLLDPEIGLVNNLFRSVLGSGSKTGPFSVYSMGGMIFVEGLHLIPLTFLLMSAAYKSMDPALEESAMMSGSGVLRTLRRITMPMLLPTAASTLLILFVRGIESFEVPAILGVPAKVFVFTSNIYLSLAKYPPNYGEAGATAVSLLALAAAGVLIYNRAAGRSERYSTVTGKAFRPRVIDLGAWRWAAFGFFILCFVVMVVLPFLMLLWVSLLPFYAVPSPAALQRVSLANYDFLFHYERATVAFRNSLLLGAGASAAVMLLTAIISWLTMKTKLFGRQALDVLAFLPIGIPGLVLGVSLIWQYISFPLPIYGTLWVLLLAYITRYMPYGMRANSGAMIQIHKELEEASKMAGGSWWTSFRRVVLPLLRPGLVAGWIYIFVISVRELGSSILLTTGNNLVLAVLVFDLYQAGRMGAMAALAVIFIAVLLIVVSGMYKLSGRFGLRGA